MTQTLPTPDLDTGGPELTVEELAALWRISAYTLREWAAKGLVLGAVQRGGRWRFPARPYLKAPVRPGAKVGDEFMPVELAEFPLTPAAVAFRWSCAEATICAYARQGLMAPCVWLARGWRFRERVKLLQSSPRFPHQSTGQDVRLPDPLVALGSLSYRQCARKPQR